jgi:hypothetical protein
LKKEGVESNEQRNEKMLSRDDFIKSKNIVLLKQKPTQYKKQNKK